MEIRLLEEKDIELLNEVLSDDGMEFNVNNIKNFINSPSAYGFIAKEDDKIVGFAYCHSLIRPDGKIMFYMHSIGVLPEYQNRGIGSQMMRFIVDFAKNKGKSEIFLITDKGNPRACHVFEKSGLINNIPNEVCYVYEF